MSHNCSAITTLLVKSFLTVFLIVAFIAEAKYEPGQIIRSTSGIKFQIVKEINVGGIGVVYQARDLSRNGQEVALKFPLDGVLIPKTWSNVHRKKTEKIVHTIEGFLDFKNLSFPPENKKSGIFGRRKVRAQLMPLATSDLAEVMDLELSSNEPIPLKMSRRIDLANQVLIDISSALISAHRLKFLHGDVKIYNILQMADQRFVLADYDSLKPVQPSYIYYKHLISLQSASPEAIRQKGEGLFSDLYSLGVTLYKILTRSTPLETLVRFHPRITEDVIKLASDQLLKIIEEKELETFVLDKLRHFETQMESTISPHHQGVLSDLVALISIFLKVDVKLRQQEMTDFLYLDQKMNLNLDQIIDEYSNFIQTKSGNQSCGSEFDG